jgi:hypothetical protein
VTGPGVDIPSQHPAEQESRMLSKDQIKLLIYVRSQRTDTVIVPDP